MEDKCKHKESIIIGTDEEEHRLYYVIILIRRCTYCGHEWNDRQKYAYVCDDGEADNNDK